MIENVRPKETVNVGLIGGRGSGGGTGNGLSVGGIGRIEAGAKSALTGMSARIGGYGRRGVHGGGHGVHDGHGCVGSCGCGIPRKSRTVDKGDTPELNFSWGENYNFLDLSQLDDLVCPTASDASIYISPSDATPAEYDNGELQGAIQLPPPNTNTYCGIIREELNHILLFLQS